MHSDFQSSRQVIKLSWPFHTLCMQQTVQVLITLDVPAYPGSMHVTLVIIAIFILANSFKSKRKNVSFFCHFLFFLLYFFSV